MKIKETRNKISEALNRLNNEELEKALDKYIPLNINTIKDKVILVEILQNILNIQKERQG